MSKKPESTPLEKGGTPKEGEGKRGYDPPKRPSKPTGSSDSEKPSAPKKDEAD